MDQPTATIVIISYNGRELLVPCLEAVFPQAQSSGAEVIVVDNGSSDGTVTYLAERFPAVRLVENGRNLGFAEGCNVGVRHARADRIVLLNNDAVPAEGWLPQLLHALDEPGVAIACSVVHDRDFPEAYALGTGSLSVIGHPVPGANPPEEPFYATGTSLAFRRSQLGEPFDPEYFAYYEDVLLSWRTRLEGYRVVRALGSHVDHLGSATARRNRPLATYFYERNKLLTLLLVYEGRTLCRLLPLYLFDGLARLAEDVWQLVRDPRERWSRLQWSVQRYWLILRGIAWLAGYHRTGHAKRRALQHRRIIRDGDLLPLLSGKIFDDVVPSRLHRAANRIAVSYCQRVGLGTLKDSRARARRSVPLVGRPSPPA